MSAARSRKRGSRVRRQASAWSAPIIHMSSIQKRAWRVRPVASVSRHWPSASATPSPAGSPSSSGQTPTTLASTWLALLGKLARAGPALADERLQRGIAGALGEARGAERGRHFGVVHRGDLADLVAHQLGAAGPFAHGRPPSCDRQRIGVVAAARRAWRTRPPLRRGRRRTRAVRSAGAPPA